MNIRDSVSIQATDPFAALATLRAQGADRIAPVRFRFLEALATRMGDCDEDVARYLAARFDRALEGLTDRLAKTESAATAEMTGLIERHPEAAGPLQEMHRHGDYRAMCRLAAGLEGARRCASVAGLNRDIAPPLAATAQEQGAINRFAATELKAVRHFGKTWARLSVDREIDQALQREPENAGPLNSHFLVLRSLAVMRELSPEYLNRFMAHIDTLLWLDQAVAEVKTAAPEAGKKKKAKRGKIR